MKRMIRGGHRLALVSITAVLTPLGAVPAFADEVPLATVPATTLNAATPTSATAPVTDAVDAVTDVVDPVDAAATTVDEVTGAATTVIDQHPGAATSVVGAVDTAAASTVDTVSNLDAGGSVASSAGNLTDAVAESAGAGGAGSDAGATTAGSRDSTGGSASHAGAASGSTQGASPLRSGRERAALTMADGAEAPRWGVHATGSCPEGGGPSCSPASGTSEEDSLAEKISEVIGLLALTGFRLLPWIAAMLTLTVLGSIAVERTRGTDSRAGRVSSA